MYPLERDGKYYCNDAARAILEGKGWTITDAGKGSTCPELPQVTVSSSTDITSSGVTLHGNVTSDENACHYRTWFRICAHEC